MASTGSCRDVIVVLRDPLLRKSVHWRLKSHYSRTTFGFSWAEGVEAVIPWEKLGLSFYERFGQFMITGSRMDEEVKALQVTASLSSDGDANVLAMMQGDLGLETVLDPDRLKFVIVQVEGNWHVALPDDSCLQIRRRSGMQEPSICSTSISGESGEHRTSALGHGDVFEVEWTVAGSPKDTKDRLCFQFYFADEANQNAESLASFSKLPDELELKLLSYFPSESFLSGLGMFFPLASKIRVPWEELNVDYSLDFLRLSKIVDPVSLKNLRYVPVRGESRAGPKGEEFVDGIQELPRSPHLTHLTICDDARALSPCLTPDVPILLPNVRNLTVTHSLAVNEVFAPDMSVLRASPIKCVYITCATEFAISVIRLFPQAKIKLDDGCSEWISLLRFIPETRQRLTHVDICNLTRDGEIMRLAELRRLREMKFFGIHGGSHLFSELANLQPEGKFARLKTVSLVLDGKDAFPVEMDEFWKSLSRAAPSLENFRFGGDGLKHPEQLTMLREGLTSLKVLVIYPGEFQAGTAYSLLDMPNLEYLRVGTAEKWSLKSYQRLMLGHGRQQRVVYLIPGKAVGGTDSRFHVSVLWTSRPKEKAEVAEKVFDILWKPQEEPEEPTRNKNH